MGTNQSLEDVRKKFKEKLSNEFFLKGEMHDNRFGDIQIFKHKELDEYIMGKIKWCKTQEDLNRYLKHIQDRHKFTHEHLLKMLGVLECADNGLCGDVNKITTYFEYFPHNLNYEIKSEIWYIASAIISACAFLQKEGIFHGDIKPQNIFLTNEGKVKIADNGLIHSNLSGYFKMLTKMEEQSYLSPLLLVALEQRNLHPKHNFIKSDIFSLGMTLLETATLSSINGCYNWSSFAISYDSVNFLLNKVKQIYSSYFVMFLCDLLLDDENRRPDFLELENVLQNYKFSNNPLPNEITPQIIVQPSLQNNPNMISYKQIEKSKIIKSLPQENNNIEIQSQRYLPTNQNVFYVKKDIAKPSSYIENENETKKTEETIYEKINSALELSRKTISNHEKMKQKRNEESMKSNR